VWQRHYNMMQTDIAVCSRVPTFDQRKHWFSQDLGFHCRT
jgi:hypothetical protein